MSEQVARDGVQVHGGMGFIEETGAAQHYRDAKILTIYEGTTAIQANDMVGRKTVRDGVAVAKALIAQIRDVERQLGDAQNADFAAIAQRLQEGSAALEQVVEYVVANIKTDVKAVFAGSVTYLKLAAWMPGRAMPLSTAPRSARRASLLTTSCRRRRDCARRSWTVRQACWRWRLSSSDSGNGATVNTFNVIVSRRECYTCDNNFCSYFLPCRINVCLYVVLCLFPWWRPS
jgi:hypothetical protein